MTPKGSKHCSLSPLHSPPHRRGRPGAVGRAFTGQQLGERAGQDERDETGQPWRRCSGLWPGRFYRTWAEPEEQRVEEGTRRGLAVSCKLAPFHFLFPMHLHTNASCLIWPGAHFWNSLSVPEEPQRHPGFSWVTCLTPGAHRGQALGASSLRPAGTPGGRAEAVPFGVRGC